MGVILSYSLPLLFLTLCATANLLIPAVNGDVDCRESEVNCTESKKSTLLIFFGDSFFDVGHGRHELCLPSSFQPYGKSLYPAAPTGRFSDGLVVPDYIAKYLNLTDNEGKVAAYKGCLDIQETLQGKGCASLSFAMAGARVMENATKSKSLTDQVQIFINNSAKLFVDNGAKSVDKRHQTLYLFSIGTHDYLAQFRNIENEQDVQRVADNVTTKVVEQVKKIADPQGVKGKRFAFMSVALRYLPVLLQEYSNNDTRLHLLDKLETTHYEKLREKLEVLAGGPEQASTGQDPIFKYSILQYHSIIKAIMEKPEIYGFDKKTVTSACCGNGCYKAYGCGNLDKQGCNDPTAHVFWDGMHTTQHINQEIARIFWNGLKDKTHPQNLLTLAGTEKRPFDFSVNKELLETQSVPK